MDFILQIYVYILRWMMARNDRRERTRGTIPPEPLFKETIPSKSKIGSVELLFYVKDDIRKLSSSDPKRPVVLVFHGGGFTAGVPSMDARWISTLLATPTQPVVISVDYGLAPENPFPGAIEDAYAALNWVVSTGAEKYHLDISRIVQAGFSAGGSLALTSAMWRTRAEQSNKENSTATSAASFSPQSLRGVVAMYPGIDYRIPRPKPDSRIGQFMSGTWDAAYFARSPIDSPFVSPAAADDELLKTGLPTRIGLYPVELDHLGDACEDFRPRLAALGKTVTGHRESDATHAWDKYSIPVEDTDRWEKRDAWFARITSDVVDMLEN